ncbi:YdiU family protein [Psychromonas sp. RZ22]|uniref:protein adenylyltransferase SelO n=1 Tax=Psychromonas algarum TaxID=2555643 RepID=UPI001068A9EA|nr:YdiU family protein [Psychromonas sp. RZ22]TEW55178.1 YdiU family protein [Psychromonas sp. RZ22]
MNSLLPPLHNIFVSQLPADPNTVNNSRSIEHAAYSLVAPTPTKTSTIICCNNELASQLGFTEAALTSLAFAELITGNNIQPEIQSYAMNYGGHQFGQWAGQLGDGRAINLGQYLLNDKYVTLQLKGAGQTPYSRHADGMAVLRSSIREYLCSEAMYHLGIPTTRALTLSLTGEEVIRDKLYDGQAAYEPCAIVARVSPSFLRFGSIQLPSSRGDISLLKQTVEYSIRNDFPELIENAEHIDKSVYLNWFNRICERTAYLIVEWMRVGFVHGVLNTDNMSLIGETIDYGPYGWIDNFDLNWTPNTSDAAEKRYRFGQQAYIGQWNLFQLANAIYPLIDEAKPLQDILNNYNQVYQQQWLTMMRSKLGISNATECKEQHSHLTETDLSLCQDLEKILSLVSTDMTLFYRSLAKLDGEVDVTNYATLNSHFSECFYDKNTVDSIYLSKLSEWLLRYQQRLTLSDMTKSYRVQLMNATNPCYILRNFQVQEAIELAESGDFSRVLLLAELLKKPYQQQTKYQQFEIKRPDWATNKFGCSALSCSS